jgi:hypothetical protein
MAAMDAPCTPAFALRATPACSTPTRHVSPMTSPHLRSGSQQPCRPLLQRRLARRLHVRHAYGHVQAHVVGIIRARPEHVCEAREWVGGQWGFCWFTRGAGQGLCTGAPSCGADQPRTMRCAHSAKLNTCAAELTLHVQQPQAALSVDHCVLGHEAPALVHEEAHDTLSRDRDDLRMGRTLQATQDLGQHEASLGRLQAGGRAMSKGCHPMGSRTTLHVYGSGPHWRVQACGWAEPWSWPRPD